jgi:hypothetical protein
MNDIHAAGPASGATIWGWVQARELVVPLPSWLDWIALATRILEKPGRAEILMDMQVRGWSPAQRQHKGLSATRRR